MGGVSVVSHLTIWKRQGQRCTVALLFVSVLVCNVFVTKDIWNDQSHHLVATSVWVDRDRKGGVRMTDSFVSVFSSQTHTHLCNSQTNTQKTCHLLFFCKHFESVCLSSDLPDGFRDLQRRSE